MNRDEILARLTEIRSTLEGDLTNVNVDELQSEVRSLNDQLTQLEQRAAAARDLRNSIANMGTAEVVDTMTTNPARDTEYRNSQEYIEAYARYIVSGDLAECRSLLTQNAPEAQNGQLAVPDFVEDRIRTAWENDEFMSRVSRSFLPGNLKIGFEISGSDAVIHLEGTEKPQEETLTLGYVTLVPQSIKKWIRISDEAMDLKGQEFVDYVYDELAYKIVKKAAAVAIAAILAMPQTSDATHPAVASITAALTASTIVNAEAELTSEVSEVVAIMHRKTRSALKAIQIASGTNVGDVFDGLPVVYTDALDDYASASAGDPYMIVGDIADGIRANFPNGDDIKFKFDDLTEAEADMVKIVGRMYAGIGVVAPLRFCKVVKPA